MAYSSFGQFVEALDKAGELKRIAVPVDTDLLIAEWANREMKSPGGGKALLFEQPMIDGRESKFPLAINTMGSRKRMALALKLNSVDDLAQEIQLILKAKPPTDLREGWSLLKQGLNLLHARPKHVREGACQEVVHLFEERATSKLQAIRSSNSTFYAARSADPEMLAEGWRALHHPAECPHARPGYRRAQCRHVSHAGLRRPHDRDALAGPQSRRAPRQALLRTRRAHARGGLPRRRSGLHFRRDRAAARRPGRNSLRRFHPQEISRAGEVQDQRPRSSGRCRFRARRLRSAGRDAAGRAVRRSHRLLHRARGLSGLPPHRDHASEGRHLSRAPSSASRRWRISTWATQRARFSCRSSK